MFAIKPLDFMEAAGSGGRSWEKF